jgi:hypothetical protein
MWQLALSLLVARIGTHDVHHTTAADDLALIAHSLNAGSDFHLSLPNSTSTWVLAKHMNIDLVGLGVQGLLALIKWRISPHFWQSSGNPCPLPP